MRVTRTFAAQVSQTVGRERIESFMTRAGYRRLPASEDCLRFRRGSIFGTLTNFDPTRWACAMTVRLTAKASAADISAEARIASDPFEKQFAEELLTTELSRLEAAVTAREPGSLDLDGLRRRVRSHFYRVVGLFASLIFHAILGVLARTMAAAMLSISQVAAWMIGAGVFLALTGACLVVWSRQPKRI